MALVVDNLIVRRGERDVLAGLSLRAEPGVAVLLTGPNGAGKTTLLRALAGLLRPAGGSIRFEAGAGEANENGEALDPGESCHFVGHLNGLKPALSVAENARFWARYLGGADDAVGAALATFRLAELAHIPAAYLSAGQKRRLGLARLLLAPRPVWLLDEPAVSLDAASQALLAGVVNGHLAAGGIVVAATHQPLGLAPAREIGLAAGEIMR
jgi:heme exporter protein A